MSIATRAAPAALPSPPPLVHRFSVAQYHRMIEAGVFDAGERVELLDGWIVSKMTHNPLHAGTIYLLSKRLEARLQAGWIVRAQSPISLPGSEPEPDLVIAQGPAEPYLRAHPVPRQIALVVEVADTSLAQDRVVKARLYARARIPAYWIVNLVESKLEVYDEPKGGKAPGYRRRRDFGPDEAVPLIVGGRDLGAIAVGDILP